MTLSSWMPLMVSLREKSQPNPAPVQPPRAARDQVDSRAGHVRTLIAAPQGGAGHSLGASRLLGV